MDTDRGLVLRHISNYIDIRRRGWLFQHHDAMVPFDVSQKDFTDNGVRLREATLEPFGSSDAVAMRTGIPRYAFSDAEEQREWATLAAEGWLVNEERRLLSLGRRPRVRILDLDRTWTIEDFGYNEEDFRGDL